MRRIFAIISFSLIALIGILFSNQFLIMPWDSADLPKMKNPKIVIKKKARILEVFDGEYLIKTYKIALGFEPVGDKEIRGDGKTPEGEFFLFTKNPQSKFYLSLGVSYPSIDDAKKGLEDKIITKEEHDSIVKSIEAEEMPLQNTKLGGQIYIHGHGNATDWTAGCVALTNTDIKELYDGMTVKVPITIQP